MYNCNTDTQKKIFKIIGSNWDVAEFYYDKLTSSINANPVGWLKSGRGSMQLYDKVKA